MVVKIAIYIAHRKEVLKCALCTFSGDFQDII